MRSLVLAVAVLLSASSAFAQEPTELRRDRDHRGPGHRPARVQVAVDREEMLERMERLERLLDEAYERSDRERGRDRDRDSNRKQLRRALEDLEELQRVVANAPDVRVLTPPPPPPPPVPVVQPNHEGKLRQISEAMARESFPREKLTVLRDASQHHHFLVSQMRGLLEQFSFANDRLNAVRILWPRVLDRENGFQLYEAFPFASDKQQLRTIIGG